MLFSGGQHPLYQASDTKEEFIRKVLDPHWDFPPSMPK
jgi:hypothetical protein